MMIRSLVAKERIKIEVRLTPRASRDEVVGMRNGVLRVRVTAPPVDGKANEALRRLIAKRLGLAKGRVTIERGERGRLKLLRIEGADAEAVRRLGV
jgi:uncharacterized protein (TIGR00251 family)